MRGKIPGLINIDYSYMSGGPAELFFTHVFVDGEKYCRYSNSTFFATFSKIDQKTKTRKNGKILAKKHVSQIRM